MIRHAYKEASESLRGGKTHKGRLEEEGREGRGRRGVGTCIYPSDAPWISSIRNRSFLFSSSGCSQGWAGLDRSV